MLAIYGLMDIQLGLAGRVGSLRSDGHTANRLVVLALYGLMNTQLGLAGSVGSLRSDGHTARTGW